MDDSPLNGIIVIDKPRNMTSARVVAAVKKMLKAAKVGHAGTLDPFAEGVLICCVNRATRLAGFLLHGPKKYVAVLKLGEETDTQDLTGTLVATAKSVDFSKQVIQNVCKSFEGSIEQRPPVYSALKHKGVPLYRLARRGKPVQKPPRRVQIYSITVQDIELPFVRFEASCSAGTYIRSLGADIGKALGCGGHLTGLQRTASSGFRLDQAITLPALEELARSKRVTQCLISMQDALPDMPELTAESGLAEKIRYGRTLTTTDVLGAAPTCKPDSHIKILDQTGALIAIVAHGGSGDRLDYCCVFPEEMG
jgi:tRNA pseudouridine55 synthase